MDLKLINHFTEQKEIFNCNNGVSPNGKAWDFGSHIAGSNPATLVWQKCHVRLTYANPSPTSGMLLRAVTRLGGFSGLVAVVPVAYLYT